MRRMLALSHVIFATTLTTTSFALDGNADVSATAIQQIAITNSLSNSTATGGIPGQSQTSVLVAFNNGGAQPCYTTTLAFSGYLNISVGTGQACVAAVTSITITPVASSAGATFLKPTDISINGSYFTNRINISDNTDPVFDVTNGLVVTPGTVEITYTGQFRA